MPEFAKRISVMEGSATVVRKLFGGMNDPETISFGGGAPAQELLPVDAAREIAEDVFTYDKRGVEAFQYGPPNGIKELREIVAEKLLQPKGLPATAEDVMIVAGGLETMNLICQLYIDPGDVILVEEPTFVHCVEIFEMFQAKCIGVEGDDRGMIMEDLEAKIQQYKPKIIYTIPTFQNPSGKTLPVERRRKLAELGSQYDVIVLEDDPYRELRYSGEDLPPIKCFDKTGHTVYANSFSKIFSPGSRLGFVYASQEIIKKLFDTKTATNSQTNGIAQVIAAEYFKRGYYEQTLKKAKELYAERRDLMIACIDKYLPEGTKRVYPDGGLFTWVELPGDIDTDELLTEAAKYKVAFVAGAGFFAGGCGKGKNCMRLSYGNVTPDKIELGMQRLGALVKAQMK